MGRGTLPIVPAVRFELFGNVAHAVGTRHGGVSNEPYATLNLGYATADLEANITQNRRIFAQSAGFDQATVISARLTHGARVQVYRRADPETQRLQLAPVRDGSASRSAFFAADAVASDVDGIAFLLTFADCVPLLFHDPERGVVAAAHAGWRGTALGIGIEVIRVMRDRFGCRPADIVCGIGPSIGPCCYLVGPEVVRAFERGSAVTRVVDGESSVRLDLWATNQHQLESAGVRTNCIENPRICTSCNVDSYFSHRAENGVTGRFGLLIGRP